MSRARGPHRPSVVQPVVTSESWALPSAGEVVGEPLLVGRAVGAAGDHPEELLAEPHDREVGLEAAAGREDRCVDDPPDRDVHLPHRHALHGGERAGPGDVEDREGAQVDHAGPVAHRQVLGVRDRRPPARVPLGLAPRHPVGVLLEERRVRLVPLRPLPAGRLEEHGAELALARVERRQANVAVRPPLLARVDDAVGLVEPLGRARPDVGAGLLVIPEPRDVGRVQVDLGLAVGHPLGDGRADARPLLHPDGGAPTRGP